MNLGEQSLHCAGFPTCQDLLCFQCPHYVYVTVSMTQNPSLLRSVLQQKNKASHENTMRSSCDIDESLHPDGLWIFFSFASFEEYQNLLFLFRGLSGIEMKICSMGISVKIRGMCTFFFYSQAWWGCLQVFLRLVKTASNDQTELQTLTWQCCPPVKILRSEWEEVTSAFNALGPGMNDNRSLTFLQLSSGPKKVNNI